MHRLLVEGMSGIGLTDLMPFEQGIFGVRSMRALDITPDNTRRPVDLANAVIVYSVWKSTLLYLHNYDENSTQYMRNTAVNAMVLELVNAVFHDQVPERFLSYCSRLLPLAVPLSVKIPPMEILMLRSRVPGREAPTCGIFWQRNAVRICVERGHEGPGNDPC